MLFCESLVLFLFLELVEGSMYDESQVQYFTVPGTSTLTISSDVYKHGERSLKWTWRPGDILTLDLYNEPVEDKQLREGGIKLWLYLVRNIPGKMTLSFYTSLHVNILRAIGSPECQFDISLAFSGWRGVWVGFHECRMRNRMLPLYRMELEAPGVHRGEIYIDLLRISRRRFRKQSRDHIVPPIRGRVSPVKDSWQQTHRWSLVKPVREIFNDFELDDVQIERLKDMQTIRARLKDWYRVPGQSTNDLKGYFQRRWFGIRKKIKRARWRFGVLNITRVNGFIRGPPLFSRNSEYGKLDVQAPDLKFGFIMRDILFPLSFEHFFMSRKEEIQYIIKNDLPKLNNPMLASKTVEKLAGYDKELINVFHEKSKLGIRPLTRRRLRHALREINHRRFLRILRLLEYIKNQGWAVGSALGSLDHEMNRSSRGFVTSIFLLRKPLRRAGKLDQFIEIMKWYLEFGELYQNRFESSGTTADRMRTLFLYRLMCVLVLPEGTLQQALDKLRDMDALRNWYENALSMNSGLGGVIKPDYTSYHHMSFYPNDYVIPAMLTATHVVYLLSGTGYELTETSRRNLRNAVFFMRIVSVKYTIPNSVANSSPTVAKPELICLIPAFAYITLFEYHARDKAITSRGIPAPAIESLRAFLRLLNESDVAIQRYLARGSKCSWKTSYTYTLGSLSLMDDLKRRAKELGIEAEESPVGNWAKNFAALAVHRRSDWAVTVKGFNNFVWGHETSHRGNRYGLYQSYGQLLIANSDHATKAHNVNQGWDWTRLPGTTTLRVPMEHLFREPSRFYNPKELCGAVTFQGTSRFRNGAFIMDFQRPDYGPVRGGENKDMKFWFKKSVFFFDDLLVCLGSDITARCDSPFEAQTTLFQNTEVISNRWQSVRLNGYEVPLGRRHHARRFIWGKRSAAILMDVNGNGYYVPKAGSQNLNVWLGNQSSYHSQIIKTKTEGYFATAWMKHGVNPQGRQYEYAVLVNTSFPKLLKFACRQEKLRDAPKYEILLQDTRAHVIKFINSPRRDLTTYGYNVFLRTFLPGPIRMVGDPCIVMVEDGGDKSRRLIIGLSYPQLNFNSTRKMRTSNNVREQEMFYMRSQVKHIWVLLRPKVELQGYRVYVDGKQVDTEDAAKHVRIIALYRGSKAGSLVYFMNLLNGFTTEVHLRRLPGNQVDA